MSNSSSSNDAFSDFKLWHYNPSIPAGIIFGVIFTILTLLHLYKILRHRVWFCIPFLVGGSFEAVGYFVRVACHNNTQSIPLYVAQSLLLLLSPILFAASIYMILGRLIIACNATNYSPIRIKWLTKIFVFSDVFCFLIQSAGGGLLASAKTKADFNRDNDIVLGGLVLQVVVFCGFVVSAGVWHKRMKRKPTLEAAEVNWEGMLWALYVSSGLVTGRNLYRVVEYGMGQNGYLLGHEWSLYVFDAFFMTVVLAIGVWWYGIGLKGKRGRSSSGRNSRGILLDSRGSGEALTGRAGKTDASSVQPWR